MADRSNENDNEEQALVLVAMIVLLVFWRLVDGNIVCTTESSGGKNSEHFFSPSILVSSCECGGPMMLEQSRFYCVYCY